MKYIYIDTPTTPAYIKNSKNNKQLQLRVQSMTQNELNILSNFKFLVSQKAKVHEIRIFGSRARGDATEQSDMDVLVVVDRLDHAIEKHISDCAWEAGFAYDIVLVPVVVTTETLKNSPLRESAFVKNVYREGKAV